MNDMDRYFYQQGYQDCMKDVQVMLHKERIELDGHGDQLAIWWSIYWKFPKKLHELWQGRFKYETTKCRD